MTDIRNEWGLSDSNRSVGSAGDVDVPDVSQIDDIVDAMELCEEHDVPYDGLGDIDEFIERLRLHFIKQKFPESRKKQVSVIMLV